MSELGKRFFAKRFRGKMGGKLILPSDKMVLRNRRIYYYSRWSFIRHRQKLLSDMTSCIPLLLEEADSGVPKQEKE